MPVTEFPTLAEHVRQLSRQGFGGDRDLQRFIDHYASAEALAALHASVATARTQAGPVISALEAADAVLAGADGEANDILRDAIVSRELLQLARLWIRDLREIASVHPDTGACTLASALELWSWTVKHFARDSDTPALDELAGAASQLLAARAFVLEVMHEPSELRRDLARVYTARAAAAAGTTCAELVYGYRKHLLWDDEGCATCFAGPELDALEAFMPGIANGARANGDVIEADGSHASKAGPCAKFNGVETFAQLRTKLDGCLTGARIAKDRAAAAIAQAMATGFERSL